MIDVDYVHLMLKTMYWAEDIPRAIVEKSIKNSVSFGMYKNKKQIGFARVVSDLTIFAYLADVFIDPAEQNKGYGSQFINAIINDTMFETISRWHLLTKNAHWLYPKFGFSIPDEGYRYMERTTRPNYKNHE